MSKVLIQLGSWQLWSNGYIVVKRGGGRPKHNVKKYKINGVSIQFAADLNKNEYRYNVLFPKGFSRKDIERLDDRLDDMMGYYSHWKEHGTIAFFKENSCHGQSKSIRMP
jgi:hypothetical protein